MNYNYYLTLIEPSSHEECIIMGALIYGINFVECINPYIEYNELKKKTMNGLLINTYIPIYDQNFKIKYLNNPKWYDIRYLWEPKLKHIYTIENLINFIKNEGYTNIDNISYEEKLFQIRCIPTFYFGKYPTCKDTLTLIYYESIKDIESELLLSYGILETNKFIVFTVQELTDYFTKSKTFINPCDNKEIFSDISIQKLHNICVEISNNILYLNTNIKFHYDKLFNAIEIVKLFNSTIIAQGKQLRNYYISSKEMIKSNIDLLFIKLLHIGYYMRGWKINNEDLPINTYKTTYDKSKQHIVELNTTTAILDFENLLLEFKNIDLLFYNLFNQLPILCVQHNSSSLTFKSSSNPDMGLTIIDRINIAKDGESEYSCIRMTSNWLLASAYYYIKLCDKKEPFDIKDLSDIT